jgi:hypothetical protein
MQAHIADAQLLRRRNCLTTLKEMLRDGPSLSLSK